jgi:hypothetical protein
MTAEDPSVPPSEDDESDAADKDVTLTSPTVAVAWKSAITDDEPTTHDTTTRRHALKPIDDKGAAPHPPPRAARHRTLPSAGVRKKRSNTSLVLILACIAGGLMVWVALRTADTDTPAPPPSSGPPGKAPEPTAQSQPMPKLFLDVHIEPRGALASIDGTRMDKTEGLELEMPCPKGYRELRVEAKNHEPVIKRIPCEGRVLMDVTLTSR